MHEGCMPAGQHPCEVGADVMNLLRSKRVDFVLQGHDHTYQRSKQVSCAQAEFYISSCVINDGSTATYTEGAGTVFVVAGTFGAGLTPVNVTDGDSPYFAKMMGNTTLGAGHGFVKYTVSSTKIDATTVFSGSFSDSFSIQSGKAPQPSFSCLPVPPQVGGLTTFTSSLTAGTPPHTYHWSFPHNQTATR